MKKQNILLAAFALTAALTLTACASDKNNTDNASAEKGVFETMETVDLDGNEVDSAIFADRKITFINTWNTGCSPCVQEIPELERLNNDYADKGAAFTGLYYNFGEELDAETRSEIDSILSETGASYRQLLISEKMYEDKTISGIYAFPTTFVVNSEGRILDTLIGAHDYDGWKEIADKYLAQVGDNE